MPSGPGVFHASVRGTRLYDVSLTLDDDRLIVDCACPFFQQSIEPCKHIWAAILAADRARAFPVPADLSFDFDDELIEARETFSGEDLDEGSGLHVSNGTTHRVVAHLTVDQRRAISERMKLHWAQRRSGPAPPRRPTPPPAWQTFLSQVTPTPEAIPPRALPAGELIYVLDLVRSATSAGLLVELLTRDRKRSGAWAKPKPLTIGRNDIASLPDERDRRILDAICGAPEAYEYAGSPWGERSAGGPVPSAFVLNPTLQRDLAQRLCETDRLMMRNLAGASDVAAAQLIRVVWDPQPAEFQLQITGDTQSGYTIGGAVRRDGSAHAFTEVLFVTAALILWRPTAPDGSARLAAFDTGGADRWMTGLLDIGTVTVPADQAAALLETLVTSDPSRVECPDELRVDARVEPPQPCIRITRATDYRGFALPGARLDARVSFTYGDCHVDAWSVQPVHFDRERRLAWRRDPAAERAALARLHALGVRRVADWQTGGIKLDLGESLLPALVPVLISEGWRVEADGRLYRRAGTVTLDVRSGVDWFELHGDVDFGGISADLPTLLAAARRGETFVRLGDGTFGQLPEDWLARAGRMAAIGTPQADHVRFATCQGALLDAWLATEPTVTCDETFARARGEVARFEGIGAVDPPPTFQGILRDYQRDALGWFEFLRRFGFGGCLADEMGLGKTVMVLAAMEARRIEREQAGGPLRPSLIVVPRSLVFNWKQEAARFAPALRVLDFTGGGRRDVLDLVADHDIVLTTYGTLRRDIGHLKEMAFDYAILDEAQAIKNARTSSAKAARLLKADHRLALSGTPIENHLGELWSLFDFLNPGCSARPRSLRPPAPRARIADDGMLERARARAPAVHPAPDEGTGRVGAAGADRADALLRPGAAAAEAVRRAARSLSRGAARQRGTRRPRRREAADPRSAAAPAAGGVPSRPHRFIDIRG